jgi:hypothetical protein
MPTLSNITTKDASDTTINLSTVDVESGVKMGAIAISRLSQQISASSVFAVTTTPYAVNDTCASKLTISNAAIREGGSGAVVGVNLFLKQAMPAVVPSFNLHLFEADPVNSTFTDNGQLTISSSDALSCVVGGPIPLVAYARLSSSLWQFYSGDIVRHFQCVSPNRNLFAVLEVLTATTFAAGDFDIALQIEQDR